MFSTRTTNREVFIWDTTNWKKFNTKSASKKNGADKEA